MIHSHLQALMVFAALTSTVLALLYRPRGRRLAFGLAIFACFVLGAVGLAWLMAAGRPR